MRTIEQSRQPQRRLLTGVAAAVRQHRSLQVLLLVGPAAAWAIAFIVGPTVMTVLMSFWKVADYKVVRDLNFDSYVEFARTPIYHNPLFVSIENGLMVAAICVPVSLLTAHFIHFHVRRHKVLFLGSVVIALWLGYLLRVFGWRILLGREGVLNSLLMDAGIIDQPLSFLVFSRFAVILTQTHLAMPFAFIPIYAAMERLPRSYLQAAADLGANRTRQLLRIELPLISRGVAVGATFAFVLAFGDYFAPLLVGSPSSQMIGNIAVDHYLGAFNWPLGAAIGVVMMATILVAIALPELVRVTSNRVSAFINRDIREAAAGTVDSNEVGPAIPDWSRVESEAEHGQLARAPAAKDFRSGDELAEDARHWDLGERGPRVGGERWLAIRAMVSALPGAGLFGAVGLIYLFLYLPAIVIFVYSFNDSPIMSWPLSGLTSEWYVEAFQDSALMTGLKNSAIVATVSVLVALVLGVPAGFAFDRFNFPGKQTIQYALAMPFLLPGVISGVALFTFFLDLNVPLSLKTVIIGHATLVLAVFSIQMQVALARWNRSLEAAAMDLGATELRTFFFVVLPNLRNAIIGACLLGMTVSLDEVARTFFLTGHDNTLPMVIWSKLRIQLTPEINAIGSVVLVISLAALVVWSRSVAGQRVRPKPQTGLETREEGGVA